MIKDRSTQLLIFESLIMKHNNESVDIFGEFHIKLNGTFHFHAI